MKKRFLKVLLPGGIIFFALFITGFSVIYVKYRSIAKQNIPVKYLKTELQPGEEVALGEPLKIAIILRYPWNKYPSEVQIKPSQGSQLYALPEIVKEKREWGYTLWKICFNIQAFSVGLIPEGTLSVVSYSYSEGNINTISMKIPEFKSMEIKNVTNSLNVAGKVPIRKLDKKSKFIYFIMALFMLIGALVLFLFLRKKKSDAKILSSWEKAIESLTLLKNGYQSGSMNPLKCISLLTDIVRDYLEERFMIHASKQTTSEFLSDMENQNSPLNNKDRNFLREFMISADMIKFAKYDASKEMIEGSISRAVQLVTESIPEQGSEEGRTKSEKLIVKSGE